MSQLEDEIREGQARAERLFYDMLAFWRANVPPDEHGWTAESLEDFMLGDGAGGPIEEMCYEIAEANILAPDDLYERILRRFDTEGDPFSSEFDENGEALFVRQQQALRQATTA